MAQTICLSDYEEGGIGKELDQLMALGDLLHGSSTRTLTSRTIPVIGLLIDELAGQARARVEALGWVTVRDGDADEETEE